MKVIYKYVLPRTNPAIVVMPSGAEVLHAHEQDGRLCVWALIDPRQTETEKRLFAIVGTGNEFAAEDMRYIGTAHFQGPLVFHVFELKR